MKSIQLGTPTFWLFRDRLHQADSYGASVSTLASYLISWSCNLFLERLALFIKESKEFNQNDIASDIAALRLSLSVNRPLHDSTVRHSRTCNLNGMGKIRTNTNIVHLECMSTEKLALQYNGPVRHILLYYGLETFKHLLLLQLYVHIFQTYPVVLIFHCEKTDRQTMRADWKM